jgi:hypothetical protein
VQVEPAAAGRLMLAPKSVRSIALGRTEDVMQESTFFTGRTEPWTLRSSLWQIDDGNLICKNRGSAAAPIFAKLEQKEALTIVAKVQSMEGNNLRCDLIIFADATDGGPDMNRYGRNSVFAMFQTTDVNLQTTINGNTNHIINRPYGKATGGGVLRLAYDPASGKGHLWLDAMDLGEYPVPGKPTTGQYVMLNSIFPLKVEYVRVLRGIVPPSGEEDAPADEDISVQFTNKDRVSATKIALAEGQATLTTSYGEIKSALPQISRIYFGKKMTQEPAKGKAEVRVRTGACRLTMEFLRLTGDELVGKSALYGGEIKIRRANVQEIRFNVK